jgi:hypothetical protein
MAKELLQNSDVLAKQLGKGGLTSFLSIALCVIALLWAKSEYSHYVSHKEDKQELKEAKIDRKEFELHCRQMTSKLDSLLHIKIVLDSKSEILQNAK